MSAAENSAAPEAAETARIKREALEAAERAAGVADEAPVVEAPLGDPGTPLTRDEILGADDIVEQTISVPGWRGSIRIKNLTVAEQDAAMRIAQRGDDPTDLDIGRLNAALMVAGCVEPRFEERDIPKLMRKSSTAVAHVVKRMNELGKIDEASEETAAGSFRR